MRTTILARTLFAAAALVATGLAGCAAIRVDAQWRSVELPAAAPMVATDANYLPLARENGTTAVLSVSIGLPYAANGRVTAVASGRLMWTARASSPASSDVNRQFAELSKSVLDAAGSAGLF